MSTATLETYVDLVRNRLEMMLKVLDVDGAVRRVQGGWTATGQDWVYEQDRYDRVAAARRDEQALMLEYIATDACRMRFLREALDDPGRRTAAGATTAAASTLPSVGVGGGGRRAPATGWPAPVSRCSRARCGRPRWPTSASTSRARSRSAEEGRVVARLTDLGLGQALRDLFRPGVARPGGAGPRWCRA